MCGIAGQVLFNKKKGFTKEQQVNAIALLLNLQKRGEIAWGAYLEKSKENSHLYCGKPMSGLPGELFKTQFSPTQYFKNGSMIYLTDVHTFLMHTRLPTQGEASYNENNHPFVTKNFILAHNGSVHNDIEIKKEFKIETDIECDSYMIVALIQHYFDKGKTVIESIQAMSKTLRGSYACWLYHKNAKELYLFRNSTTPLSYYLDAENELLTFASTDDNILTSYDTDSIKEDIKELDMNHIYKFEDNVIKEVGKLETPSYLNNTNRNTTGYKGGDFNTAIVDNATSSFEYLFDLLEHYETVDEDQTIIVITPQGEVQLLIKPQPLIDILDKNGFSTYKSTDKLFDAEYREYNISTIEEFNKVIEQLKTSLEKSDTEDDDTPTTHDEDTRFSMGLKDLAETIDCSLGITGKTITFRYTGKQGLPPDTKRMFKKVGLHFRNDKTLVIKNNKHHDISLRIIMKKLGLYDIPPKKPKVTPLVSPPTNEEISDSPIDDLITTGGMD